MAITVQPSIADQYIQSNATGNNNSTAENIVLYTSAGGETIFRGLIKFDASAYTAAASTVSDAKLSLYYSSFPTGSDPVGKLIKAYKIRRADWNPSEATWDDYKTGSGWATAGAGNTTSDIDTTLVGTGTVPASAGWIEFDVTDIVKDAITNVSGIVNILLKWDNEAPGAINHINLNSRENTGSADLKPKLVVTPNPVSVSLAGETGTWSAKGWQAYSYIRGAICSLVAGTISALKRNAWTNQNKSTTSTFTNENKN